MDKPEVVEDGSDDSFNRKDQLALKRKRGVDIDLIMNQEQALGNEDK